MNRPILSALALGAVAALVACAPATGTARATPTPLVAHSVATHGTLGVSTPVVAASGGTPTPVSTVGGPASPAPSGLANGVPSPAPSNDADREPGGGFGSDTPAPAPSASPAATPAPVATPTGIPYVAPDDPPQILSFWISETTVHPGDVLSGGVTASSNVASVEVRVAGYSYLMAKTGPGRFELSATVPSVPRIFRRTYPLVAIARNTRGDATQRATQITIR